MLSLCTVVQYGLQGESNTVHYIKSSKICETGD